MNKEQLILQSECDLLFSLKRMKASNKKYHYQNIEKKHTEQHFNYKYCNISLQ